MTIDLVERFERIAGDNAVVAIMVHVRPRLGAREPFAVL